MLARVVTASFGNRGLFYCAVGMAAERLHGGRMKTGTEHHIKTKRLKKLLGIPHYQVVGVLESLWLATAQCAWAGDIGKYTNEEIADQLEWDGDADELITALVDARWLDRDDTHRLVVHGWMEHCPEFIKKRVDRRPPTRNKDLGAVLSDNGRQTATTADSGGDCPEMSANGALTQPNPTQPIQAQPNPTKPESKSADAAFPPPELDRLIDAWNELPESIASKVTKRDGKGIREGWNRASKAKDLRGMFDDPAAIITKIRGSPFVHGQGWFTFTWLFACGKTGDWNIEKLMSGNYERNGKPAVTRTGPGQLYDPDARSKDPNYGKF